MVLNGKVFGRAQVPFATSPSHHYLRRCLLYILILGWPELTVKFTIVYMWGPSTKRSIYICIYICRYTRYSRNVCLGLGRCRMQLLLAIVTSSGHWYKSIRRRLSPLRLLIKRATGEISFHTSFLTLWALLPLKNSVDEK